MATDTLAYSSNNTNVTCSVYTRGAGLLESDPAVLQVQGMSYPLYSIYMLVDKV